MSREAVVALVVGCVAGLGLAWIGSGREVEPRQHTPPTEQDLGTARSGGPQLVGVGPVMPAPVGLAWRREEGARAVVVEAHDEDLRSWRADLDDRVAGGARGLERAWMDAIEETGAVSGNLALQVARNGHAIPPRQLLALPSSGGKDQLSEGAEKAVCVALAHNLQHSGWWPTSELTSGAEGRAGARFAGALRLSWQAIDLNAVNLARLTPSILERALQTDPKLGVSRQLSLESAEILLGHIADLMQVHYANSRVLDQLLASVLGVMPRLALSARKEASDVLANRLAGMGDDAREIILAACAKHGNLAASLTRAR